MSVAEFDSQVQESKGKAQEALTQIPDIRAGIDEARQKTTNAQEAMARAGTYEETAKKQLEFAENTAQVIRQIVHQQSRAIPILILANGQILILNNMEREGLEITLN